MMQQQNAHFISDLYNHPPFTVDASGELFEIELARLATAISQEGAAQRRAVEVLAEAGANGRKGTDSVIEFGKTTGEEVPERDGIIRHLSAYRHAAPDHKVTKFLEWRNRTRRPPRVDPITTASERR